MCSDWGTEPERSLYRTTLQPLHHTGQAYTVLNDLLAKNTCCLGDNTELLYESASSPKVTGFSVTLQNEMIQKG